MTQILFEIIANWKLHMLEVKYYTVFLRVGGHAQLSPSYFSYISHNLTDATDLLFYICKKGSDVVDPCPLVCVATVPFGGI